MTRLQEEVRRTLQEIADVPPPEGLAAAAIRRARTTRRRIVAACAAGAAGAAVIVAAVAFPVALPPVERPAPRWEVAPAPTPERALGPDRWIVSAYGGQLPGNGATDPANWTLLRNPAGGTYRPLAFSLLAASPR